MKINSAPPPTGSAPAAGSPRTAAATSRPAEAGASERVDISPLSARLQEAGTGRAPVDAGRVAEIKQAIAEGRFQINPERIADGLLASVRELLARGGRAA